MEWRFSFYEPFAPGEGLVERVTAIRAADLRAVELNTSSVRADEGRHARKVLNDLGMAASAVCGGLRGNLLSDDAHVRRLAVDDLKRLLAATETVGAQGLVVAPLIGAFRLPDLSPWKGTREVHDDLFCSLLGHVSPTLTSTGRQVWIEALNRYRTQYVYRIGQAVDLCRRMQTSAVRVMVDTFHLTLEEDEPDQALRDAGGLLAHIHLVDGNRRLPGEGSTDFRPIMKALQEDGYEGYLTFECPVGYDFSARVKRAVFTVLEAAGAAANPETERR